MKIKACVPTMELHGKNTKLRNYTIIIIASRDDDGGWNDYLQRQSVQLREMMCEMSEEI